MKDKFLRLRTWVTANSGDNIYEECYQSTYKRSCKL